MTLEFTASSSKARKAARGAVRLRPECEKTPCEKLSFARSLAPA
jgi:hypothetical protein